MNLGEFGVFARSHVVGAEAAAGAELAEELGFGAFWLGGSPEIVALRPLLGATERIVCATGIVNVWQSKPERVARDFAELSAEFPGRVLLGLGIGHPEATTSYASPLAMMEGFLTALDAADPPVPRERRCVGALRPKMLELSARRSLGAHPYLVPVEHTRVARSRLGPHPLLAPEVTCVVDEAVESARAKARGFVKGYLALRNYRRSLLDLGFDQHELAAGGSDRLIDAVVPHGSARQIAAAARAHLAAGANHVCLQPVGVDGIPRAELRALAAALGPAG